MTTPREIEQGALIAAMNVRRRFLAERTRGNRRGRTQGEDDVGIDELGAIDDETWYVREERL
jgi:hypothetical protein